MYKMKIPHSENPSKLRQCNRKNAVTSERKIKFYYHWWLVLGLSTGKFELQYFLTYPIVSTCWTVQGRNSFWSNESFDFLLDEKFESSVKKFELLYDIYGLDSELRRLKRRLNGSKEKLISSK